LRHSLRRGRDSNAVPSSDSIPASPCPPIPLANWNSSAEIRTRSRWPSAARLTGSALVLSIGKARSIVVTEPIELRFDFTRLCAFPPNTLRSSNCFRHSNKHAQTKPHSPGHSGSGTAFGWFSFLIRFTAKSGAPVGSFCQSRLCSSARRIPRNRAVLASAPLRAPLRSGN